MSSDLKPGDRCVIVGRRMSGGAIDPRSGRCGHAGMRCVVISGTQHPWDATNWPADALICEVRAECGCAGWIFRSNLIPLPPDSEMRQMFREAERPREAA